MLSTLTLCATLLLPMAGTDKAAENASTAPVVKTDAPTTAEKTTDKSNKTEQSDKSANSEEKSADKNTDKAASDKPSTEKPTAEKTAEKTAEANKDAKKKEDDPRKEEDKELLPIEANIVSYTNNERARYGLPPLEVDQQLMKTARSHCSWMTWNRIFKHTRRPVAENIAMGQPSSQEVVRSWMNSSGHRANILNPNHRRIGVGAYRTEGGTIYWVQQFSQ